ncbi:MAG: GIY-YIG nuclease family protein [Dehalococcoidia bacterium]
MSTERQPCAAWGCEKTATYKKPFCYEHFLQWDKWELEECNRCHWFFGLDDHLFYEFSEYTQDLPFECDNCMRRTLVKSPLVLEHIRCRLASLVPISASTEDEFDERISLEDLWAQLMDSLPEERPPVPPRIPLQHIEHFVYILKLSDASFYIGQTKSLAVRLQEHKDGLQSRTKGKNPKLVYFKRYIGDRREVTKTENRLTVLNRSAVGRRRLRELIENFRAPLRLLDLQT